MSSKIIRSQAAAIGVLEAAHTLEGSAADWLERIARSVERLLHAPRGVAVVIVEQMKDGYRVWNGENDEPASSLRLPKRDAELYGTLAGYLARANPQLLDAYYQRGLVGTRSEIAPTLPPELEDPSALVLREKGVKDSLGLNARAGRLVLNISMLSAEGLRLTPSDRQLLSQVTLHVSTAFQLRSGIAPEVAIIHPDGRLLHAVGAARDQATASPLVRHVGAVERARSRLRRSTPEALDTWRALVSGSWGLAERVDGDGARHYVVLSNPAPTTPLRALSPLEAKVLELSARGVSGKLVAYALGVTSGRVSQLLGTAALKIGCASRTEVVRVAAAMLGGQTDLEQSAALTTAEREVLRMVRRGFSNAEIAQHRSSSPRTVANQVASLLLKARVPSRRALAAQI